MAESNDPWNIYAIEENSNAESESEEEVIEETPERGTRLSYGPPEMIGSKPGHSEVVMDRIRNLKITPDKFFDIFQEVEFFEKGESYAAIEFTLTFLAANPNIEKVVCGGHEFLYVAERNVGVLMNFILYEKPAPDILPHEVDVHHRITCFSTCRSSISAFFSKYPGAILAVDVTKDAHDTVIFMRKLGRGFDYVHFNPNFNERLSLAEVIFNKMSKERTVRGYSAEGGSDPWNTRGSCSAHVWQQVYRFMKFKFNPFERKILYPCNARYRVWMYPRDILIEERKAMRKRRKVKLRFPNQYWQLVKKAKEAIDQPMPVADQQPEKKKRKRDI